MPVVNRSLLFMYRLINVLRYIYIIICYLGYYWVWCCQHGSCPCGCVT